MSQAGWGMLAATAGGNRKGMEMFEGFAEHALDLVDSRVHYLRAGAGPPLVLLHGYPQTHLMWHKIAPRLAERFTVIVPDLPGYGASAGPDPAEAGHEAYAKRETARRISALMAELGYPRFALAGHDRGGRVGYRLALDDPDRVSALALLDIVPTGDVWAAMDADSALKMFHWPFLAAPSPLPERLIQGDSDFFIDSLLDRWAGEPDALDADARAAYVRQFRCPSVVQATCADYRAGATVDRDHDEADRANGRQIQCPVHVVWGTGFLTGDVLARWRPWCAAALDGTALPTGHFVAEEAPGAVLEALQPFFDAER